MQSQKKEVEILIFQRFCEIEGLNFSAFEATESPDFISNIHPIVGVELCGISDYTTHSQWGSEGHAANRAQRLFEKASASRVFASFQWVREPDPVGEIAPKLADLVLAYVNAGLPILDRVDMTQWVYKFNLSEWIHHFTVRTDVFANSRWGDSLTFSAWAQDLGSQSDLINELVASKENLFDLYATKCTECWLLLYTSMAPVILRAGNTLPTIIPNRFSRIYAFLQDGNQVYRLQ